LDCDEPCLPFHGIVSRGVLQRLYARQEPIDVWHRHAHEIYDDTAPFSDSLERLRLDAAECAALSFEQSALAARRFMERRLASLSCDYDLACTLWNIKEGHTSSVWQVTLRGTGGAVKDEFIINVARDADSGRELAGTSAKMQQIACFWPNANLAKVLAVESVSLDCGIDVLVTCNELVRDACEIHILADRQTGRRRWVLVERFLSPQPDRPAHIRSIQGRELSQQEYQRVAADVNGFLSTVRKRIAVDVDINDGDVVWNGKQAMVVAVSQ